MKYRKQFRTVHLWLTFLLGLFVASAGLSGGVLVFRKEIDRMLAPGLLRVEPGGAPAPLAEVMAAVERARPGDLVGMVSMPRAPDETYEVWTQSAARPRTAGIHLVYVDPYSAEVLGTRRATRAPMLVLLYWHTQYLVGGAVGTTLTALGGVAVVALSVTGVVLWWPGRRKLRTALTIKRGAGWRRTLYDLHRAGGFYLLPLLLLISTSGLALVFHDQTWSLVNRLTGSPPEPEVPTVAVPAGASALPTDSLLRVADRVLPDAPTVRLLLPRRPGEPFIARKRFESELHPNGKTFVMLDPYTGEVLALRSALEAPPGWRIADTLYPLHKGAVGGIWTRILHALAGLMLGVFFITGWILWWNRTRAEKRRRSRPRTRTPEPQPVPAG